ncbi:MAG: hypothetical protein U1F12_00315 [Pseudomonadales bacterium]|jgi:hypothetical protein|nr:hypothetical protein [Pseudomonadales bacterium]
MTLGSWNPADNSETVAYRVDSLLLEQCAAFAEADQWQDLAAWEKQLPTGSNHIMKLGAHDWQDALAPLDEATLLHLVRFFTLVEQQLPHWHGGDKSPVIWISRLLKKRGTPLSRETVLWIKANTDNRFLPNGPAL